MTLSETARWPAKREHDGFGVFLDNSPGAPGNVKRASQFGLTRSRSNNRCPLTLVGKRPHTGGFFYNDECWCNHRLNDHGACWRTSDGKRYLIWEPYGADGEELAEVLAAAKRDGLGVHIGTSFWYPSRTVGIWFFKEEDYPNE